MPYYCDYLPADDLEVSCGKDEKIIISNLYTNTQIRSYSKGARIFSCMLAKNYPANSKILIVSLENIIQLVDYSNGNVLASLSENFEALKIMQIPHPDRI